MAENNNGNKNNDGCLKWIIIIIVLGIVSALFGGQDETDTVWSSYDYDDDYYYDSNDNTVKKKPW
ncbi:MAG: hypothetical protein IJC65_02880 [Oscillospiraceae bacterium]|nr:hypothetical protein [Oscillospiraceae bacterium]